VAHQTGKTTWATDGSWVFRSLGEARLARKACGRLCWLARTPHQRGIVQWQDIDLDQDVVLFRRGFVQGRVTPLKTEASRTNLPREHCHNLGRVRRSRYGCQASNSEAPGGIRHSTGEGRGCETQSGMATGHTRNRSVTIRDPYLTRALFADSLEAQEKNRSSGRTRIHLKTSIQRLTEHGRHSKDTEIPGSSA
jgi:hypothetical protein